ncbi:MAG TPA: VOC family protein [Segeticoccus sp.]|nr:VOC family protein [Segeticoccus sp.]
MLSQSPITTMLRVRDASDAVAFYRDRLGLKYEGHNSVGEEKFAVGGGAGLLLMPDADATPSGRTELSFEVDDITGAIKDLEGQGILFADYDLPELTTVDHVAVLDSDKAAWFEDPSGNVLCLHETIRG